MELTVSQAQELHDELAKSSSPTVAQACVALLGAIWNVNETGNEYELSLTILPEETEEKDEEDTEVEEKKGE